MTEPSEGWSNPDGHEPMTDRPRPMTKPLPAPPYEPEPASYEETLLDSLAKIRDMATEAMTYEDPRDCYQALAEIVKEVDR